MGSTVVVVESSEVLVAATLELDDVEEAPLIDLSELHAPSASSATPATRAQWRDVERRVEVAYFEVCM
ncbi:MAG TPA: hypothetical protein PK020_23205 [Ilumatobacteraceae bacterium]|nr:hypothetical protein [Ilumatobacteraceae bacterium]